MVIYALLYMISSNRYRVIIFFYGKELRCNYKEITWILNNLKFSSTLIVNYYNTFREDSSYAKEKNETEAITVCRS